MEGVVGLVLPWVAEQEGSRGPFQEDKAYGLNEKKRVEEDKSKNNLTFIIEANERVCGKCPTPCSTILVDVLC
jgi:hypothetical protein